MDSEVRVIIENMKSLARDSAQAVNRFVGLKNVRLEPVALFFDLVEKIYNLDIHPVSRMGEKNLYNELASISGISLEIFWRIAEIEDCKNIFVPTNVNIGDYLGENVKNIDVSLSVNLLGRMSRRAMIISRVEPGYRQVVLHGNLLDSLKFIIDAMIADILSRTDMQQSVRQEIFDGVFSLHNLIKDILLTEDDVSATSRALGNFANSANIIANNLHKHAHILNFSVNFSAVPKEVELLGDLKLGGALGMIAHLAQQGAERA